MTPPQLILDLTEVLMPPHRQVWARAMRRELDERRAPDEALIFALGCLSAAVRERIQPMRTAIMIGRWSVAAVTTLYAVFHLKMAWNAGRILLGGPDWYHDKLIQWGHPDRAAEHTQVLPLIFAYMLAMGITHLGAAIFLARWRPKLFVGFAVSAALVSLTVVIPALIRIGDGAIPFQAAPVAMLSLAAWAFAWFAHKAPRTA